MKKQVTLVLVAAASTGWMVAHSFHIDHRGAETRVTWDPPLTTSESTASIGTNDQPLPPAPLVELDRTMRKFVLSQRRRSVASVASTQTPLPAEAPVFQGPGGKVVTDPVAREALVFVGADPEAEAYWFEAINDPTLSASERQDLIEDLNEEGFPDPRHPTADDLPLIVNRLELIEEIAADAMDDVNSDAFAEAHKDLVRMAQIAEADVEE
jgi:hypothetical protein